MSELPKGWIESTLGDACVRASKINPKDDPDKEITYLDIGGIDNNALKIANTKTYTGADAPSRARQLVEEGDVLFSTVRTYLKKIAQVSAQYDGEVASTGFTVLRGGDALDPKYLFYYVTQDSFIKPLSKIQRGTSYPAVRDSDVLEQPIVVAPIPEQRRIVARIEELFSRLDAGVAALRHARVQLQRYRQSVLAAAVTGQLTQEWREQRSAEEPAEELLERILEERRENWSGRGKYKEPVEHDASDLKELPGTWDWSSFESVLTELRNGISKKPDAAEGLRILRISAVRPLVVDLEDSRFLPDALSDFAIYELQQNDLLFTRYNGTRAYVGVCGLVPVLSEPFVYPDKLIRARLVDPEALLPAFVEIAMNAGESRRFLEKRIRTTAGQSGISGGDIKVTPLPIPPLAEQHQVVAEVEARTTAIDHLEAELGRQITRSNRLRQSTLASAFAGNLDRHHQKAHA